MDEPNTLQLKDEMQTAQLTVSVDDQAILDDSVEQVEAEKLASDVLNEQDQAAGPEETDVRSTEAEPETEVLKEMVEVIREDPAIDSAFEVARQTPDIFCELQPILSRRDELEAVAEPGQRHRTLTPLFAGMVMSKRGKELLTLAMDRHSEVESGELLEIIREGETYTSEVVVGSGVHAAIYNAERMALNPDDPALTLESSEVTGGQFAEPEGPVWRLNTRTRPDVPNAPHVPGGSASLNTLERGVVQQADIAGTAYASQDTLALPVRINHLLYSKIMSQSEVVCVSENDEQVSGRPGKYVVTLHHAETDEDYTITTDRVVFASGLGEPITGFESADDDTKRILAEETAKFEAGEDAQIMTFEQFAERVGDESNPFPLRQFGWVSVIGPGDGGAVAAEYMLGYGPDTRKSTVQLDRVKELFWIGQGAATRDEFMQASRQRYRDLALEFPVDNESGYNHRVTPIQGRAYKLERTEDGRIRILYGTKGEDGKITPTGDVVVDHIVLATGFKKTTDTVCADIMHPDENGETDELVYSGEDWAIARRYKGTDVYRIGPGAELPVSRRDSEDSPAIRRGKTMGQTVAVWASAEETAEAARLLSEMQPPADRPPSLTTHNTHPEPIDLPPFNESDGEALQSTIEVRQQAIESLLKIDSVTEDVARLAVGIALQNYIFPPQFEGLRLTAHRSGNSENGFMFEVSVEPQVPSTEPYMTMLGKLLEEPLLQAVLVRLTDKSVHSKQTATLDIPVFGRKVSLGEVELRVKRR